MSLRFPLCLIGFILSLCNVYAQLATLSGQVQTSDSKPVADAVVTLKGTKYYVRTSADGAFVLKDIPYGSYTLVAFSYGKELLEKPIVVSIPELTVDFVLGDLNKELDEVVVQSERERTFGITRMKAVENFGIYEGKKTEVVVMKDITANLATNNPRQIFARVPSLNIWEMDRAGLQLSIGARGLNPNRTANFNTRQNGYDIAAESIGYPESYYTPPMEALERIEVVRGAASLQYGPQFGGMVNFVMKKPAAKPFEFVTRQTVGSWKFFNSFNSISGTYKKLGYYGFYQYKAGDGWRPNADFTQHTAYLALPLQLSDKLKITPEYTYMTYLAHQPGGLTDTEFEEDPRQSNRARNWMRVNWNLVALSAEYKLSDQTQLNWRNFLNLSSRDAIGNLERINVYDDPSSNRTLIADEFKNVGSELRMLHQYRLGGQQNHLLVGARFYRSYNLKQQGDANNASTPDFYFLNPDNLENSDYTFHNTNVALFAENIFTITDKFSITPGIRWESISTNYTGYYKRRVFDTAGNLVYEERNDETRKVPRNFVLLGIGLSYKKNNFTEYYANFSQNYRAVTFADVRINNPSIVVDSTIKDERGYNIDLGIRGSHEDWFTYDVSLFYMRYNNRIDLVPQWDSTLLIQRRFRTNIGTSRHIGAEVFAEVNLWRFLSSSSIDKRLTVFGAMTLADARYVTIRDEVEREISTEVKKNNFVAFAPQLIGRGGITFGWKNWKAIYQASYTSLQYSDAANSDSNREATATLAPIYSYYVMDLSLSYRYKFLVFEGSVNNLTNHAYFTRRADSYPGPGIIPADGRSFYLTVQARF
ncbi:TonB-dependent receptor domain-containing protein [Xanthocytophaga agilis]|uniref:TonB-dependent receptor n=1 Tax=Xanthocytophaga agilis TaxID=3048010 RepID=A0AAE3RCY1_9BACT|nr:TonB-dependent receptor [Xanthocytophaga agilis]MDJ1505373.1 TonB-dependent receptor [Xanthocytophaga agilis]